MPASKKYITLIPKELKHNEVRLFTKYTNL